MKLVILVLGFLSVSVVGIGCSSVTKETEFLSIESFSISGEPVRLTQNIINITTNPTFDVTFSKPIDTVNIRAKVKFSIRDSYYLAPNLSLSMSSDARVMTLRLDQLLHSTEYTLTFHSSISSMDKMEYLHNDVALHFLTATTFFLGIKSFSFDVSKNIFLKTDRKGSIVNQDINVSLDATMTESQIRSLRPTIIYSGASISPSPDISQDFTGLVTYVVRSESGNILPYRVNAVIENASREAILSSFSLNLENGLFSGAFDGNNINFSFPFGTNLKGKTPIVQISPNATINPPIATPLDFYDDTKPPHYVVTAQDKTTRNDYKVNISYTPITFALVGGGTQLGSTAFATSGALFQVGGLKDNPLWKYTFTIEGYEYKATGTFAVTGGIGRINNPFNVPVWNTISSLIGAGKTLPIELKLSIEGLTHEKPFKFNTIQISN